MNNDTKRLYRVEQGAKISGVCGGVGEFFCIDPNLVRILWVIVTLCSAGIGLAVYLVASLILPKKSDIYPGY